MYEDDNPIYSNLLLPVLSVALSLGTRGGDSTLTLREGKSGQEVCVSLINGSSALPIRDVKVLLKLTSLTTSEKTTVFRSHIDISY